VKLAVLTADGRDTDCTNQLTICDIDGQGRPEIVNFWTVQGRTQPALRAPDFEVNARGSKLLWIQGALVSPGRHVIRVENNFSYCGDESRLGHYVLFGAAAAIEQARERPPASIEFVDEAGRSYVVDCNFDWAPWARIIPQEDR
jgi:hypothetical protein